MNQPFPDVFQECIKHRSSHLCGAYPYASGEILSPLSKAISARKILEVGTGLGYSTLCLLESNPLGEIVTIDQDATHVATAKKIWEQHGYEKQITTYVEKAEDVLSRLSEQFDLIFFDGYVPQMKMLLQFEKLLRKDGILVTTNLFLRDEKGGKYLKALLDRKKWETGIFSDTAISTKLI
ncbi:MAG: class I SAM-dependent methyltransferase [Candidatus Levybacteria bacterium]|nr:class I SAM-dependent methyltransferase [Candidatus Levybacteria bacterium]